MTQSVTHENLATLTRPHRYSMGRVFQVIRRQLQVQYNGLPSHSEAFQWLNFRADAFQKASRADILVRLRRGQHKLPIQLSTDALQAAMTTVSGISQCIVLSILRTHCCRSAESS